MLIRATNPSLRICNSYCFYIAAVVAKMRLSVSLYVRCLSCWFCASFLSVLNSPILLHLLPYLLTPYSIILFEKLTGSQLVKKFPTFYGTRMFNTAFTSARHLSAMKKLDAVHTPTFHFLKIHLNILILSSHLLLGFK